MAQLKDGTKGSGGLKNVSINKNPKASRLPDRISTPKRNILFFIGAFMDNKVINLSLTKHEYISIVPMNSEIAEIEHSEQ